GGGTQHGRAWGVGRVANGWRAEAYRGQPYRLDCLTSLGVANVLEGTVRRHGNHVRVSTELVDARNDNTIWAGSYDRDLTDIFSIQSEIAQIVASKLRARLSPEEYKGIEEAPTNNFEAYDLYLRAKQIVARVSVYLCRRMSEKISQKRSIS